MFLNEAGDSLHSIVDLWNENVWLASKVEKLVLTG